jgi:hypothetical protein
MLISYLCLTFVITVTTYLSSVFSFMNNIVIGGSAIIFRSPKYSVANSSDLEALLGAICLMLFFLLLKSKYKFCRALSLHNDYKTVRESGILNFRNENLYHYLNAFSSD